MTPVAARRLFGAASTLTLASVALAAGGLGWRLSQALASGGDPGPAFAEAAAVSIDPILALTPFGRIAPPEAASPAADNGALGLTLHGVVISARPAASIAIVSGAGPAAAYAPGQAIGGATLAEVHADRVVLETANGPVTLAFPEAGRDAGGAEIDDGYVVEHGGPDEGLGGGGLDALRAIALEQASPDGADDDAGFDAMMPDASAPSASDPPAADPSEATVADLRARLLDDPQALIDDLGLVAGADGYSVDETASAEVLRAGLLPGDVVAKVNGQQVGNIDADRRFFDEVAVSDRARLDVVRNGERMLMSFPLR